MASLPDSWHEVQDPDHIVEKYRPRNPTMFVREGHDVGVHVLPVSTSSPHSEESYRVGAIQGSADNFEREEPIQTFDDQEAAYALAIQFATRYEQAYEQYDDETTALERAVESLDHFRAVEWLDHFRAVELT